MTSITHRMKPTIEAAAGVGGAAATVGIFEKVIGEAGGALSSSAGNRILAGMTIAGVATGAIGANIPERIANPKTAFGYSCSIGAGAGALVGALVGSGGSGALDRIGGGVFGCAMGAFAGVIVGGIVAAPFVGGRAIADSVIANS